MTAKRASPCIDICRFAGPGGWCVGCGRTQEEARQWRRLAPFAQQRILGDLARRLERLRRAGLVASSDPESSSPDS